MVLSGLGRRRGYDGGKPPIHTSQKTYKMTRFQKYSTIDAVIGTIF